MGNVCRIYPSTNFKATEQLVIDRGEGVYVYDKQGKQYLEGMAGLWCTGLGYGNRELIDAISGQLSRMSFTHMFGGKTHQPGIDLANQLAAMVPVKDAKVFLATRAGRQRYPHQAVALLLQRHRQAWKTQDHHARAGLSRRHRGRRVLTSLPANLAHFDSPLDALGILRTDHPHYYRGARTGETEAEFVARITANLEALIEREGLIRLRRSSPSPSRRQRRDRRRRATTSGCRRSSRSTTSCSGPTR